MAFLLLAGPVSGSVPAAFADPPAMLVGLIILIGTFVWIAKQS